MKHRQSKMNIFVVLLYAILMIGCKSCEKQMDANELSSKLQAIVDSVICVESEDPIHSAVLLVECPGFQWKGAAGMADGKNETMTADHKIKIASIGKSFTATLILQLMEDGYLHLDDTIDKFLDNPVVKLDSLHIYEGVAYGRQITVEQLLHHTSGIKDYMEDPRFIPRLLEYPQTQYSPAKILNMYYEFGTNRKAVFPPGKGFSYSDPNYVLLAMIVEHVTGRTYHAMLKERIFEPLGMENSYLEYYEEPRGDKPLSHAFASTIDLITDLNTSCDWGGGGIVSTCEELNRFFRALIGGKLFDKDSTLKLMLSAADEGRGVKDVYDYGLGIMKRSIHGLTFYGHGGAYDCDAFYCPVKDISVCMSLNQTNTHGKRNKFLRQAVMLIM
ncbi:MAG: beta-lactamase family protein [Gemmatimonadota bacterium]|nr:MAG: beta-lactamase family protein [Gemmatimonadota bacterium]